MGKGSYSYKAVFYASFTAMIFFGIVLISLGTVLPEISSKFGLDDLETSSIVLLLPAGVLAGSLVFGPFIDRFGYKLLLTGSSLLVSTGLVLLSIAEDIVILRIAVFLTGFGGGTLNGEAITLVSDISPVKNKDSNQSFLSVFFGLGALMVPLIMRTLSNVHTFETVLKAIAFIIFLLTLSFLFINFPLPKQPHGFPVKEGVNLIKQPALLLFSVVLFFQSGIEGITNNWTTTYFSKTLLMPGHKAVMALTLMVSGMTIGRFITGLIVYKIESYRIVIACSGIVLCGILAIIFLPSAKFIAMFLLGIGFAPVFPVILGYIGALYPALSGTAFSIALFISLIGNTILNFLMGLLAQHYGMRIMPFFLLVSILIMTTVFMFTMKKLRLKKTGQ